MAARGLAVLFIGLMLGGCMQSTPVAAPVVQTDLKPRDKKLLANGSL
jgi:hypothetical protein